MTSQKKKIQNRYKANKSTKNLGYHETSHNIKHISYFRKGLKKKKVYLFSENLYKKSSAF